MPLASGDDITEEGERRAGFTLVELSIVLVIIGFLIGGILVAQSMISSAKIQAAVSQIQQFDIGVQNFRSQFSALPGDAPAFGGNGDGVISFDPFNNGHQAIFFGCEIGNFWGSFLPDEFPTYACQLAAAPPTSSGIGTNVPASKLGKRGSFFVGITMSDVNGVADYADPRNVYVILDSTQAQTIGNNAAYNFHVKNASNSAVKPIDLLSLDTKLDDGLANLGNVISGNMQPGPFASPLSSCSQGAAYRVENNGFECTPLIRIGGIVGE